jgi:dihydropteroate synthase
MNCKGTLIDLSTPKVMGILNITPDSFYDGGKNDNEQAIIDKVKQMLDEGATFIDIGAYSSKPNAEFVSEAEELNRLIPIIDLLVKVFRKLLSLLIHFEVKWPKMPSNMEPQSSMTLLPED